MYHTIIHVWNDINDVIYEIERELLIVCEWQAYHARDICVNEGSVAL
jgi:hypothetical protein